MQTRRSGRGCGLVLVALLAGASVNVAQAGATYGSETTTSSSFTIGGYTIDLGNWFGGGGFTFPRQPPTGVPEPGALLLFGLGLVGVGLATRAKRKRVS